MKELLGLVVPGLANQTERTLAWYRVYGELFTTMCDDSAILNWGWSEDPSGPVDLVEAQRDMVRNVTRDLPDGDWLDCGCGLGGAAMLASREREVAVTGLNLHPDQVRAAKEEAIRQGSTARFVEGNAQDMPFPDDSFDAIYCIESALHYPDKMAFLREARRVLRPGGRVAVCDIVRGTKATGLREAFGMEYGRWLYACPPLWSAPDWAQGMTDAGLSDATIRDVSREVLGVLPHWAEKFRTIGGRLSSKTPPGVYFGARVILDRLAADPLDLPIRYALITAQA